MKKQVLGFLIVGSATVLLDFLTYTTLVDFFGLSFEASKAVSFAAGTMLAYSANRFWTFSRSATDSRGWLRFLFLYVFSLGINVSVNSVLLFLLFDRQLRVEIGFLFATIASASLNFVGMKYYVFRQVRRPGSD